MTTPCSIGGCEKPRRSRGWCGMHWKRWRRYGDPLACRFEQGVVPGYHAAHQRIYRARGRARDHACQHCGAPARHWGYDHRDPGEHAERLTIRGREMVLAYSLDPAHYVPLCTTCHRRFDLACTA